MGQILERKIGRVSSSSFMVILPKGWLRFHRFEAGGKVLVRTNGKLRVEPIKRPVKRPEA